MSMSATPERPIPHHIAWSQEKRESDCRKCLDNALSENRLQLLKPGFVAGTFGLTKSWVKDEMTRRCEAAGSAK